MKSIEYLIALYGNLILANIATHPVLSSFFLGAAAFYAVKYILEK